MGRAVYDGARLELRRDGKRSKVVGRFPFLKLTVIADRGKVRKERILPGAFDFTLDDVDAEVSFLFGHNFDTPLASRQAGTLALTATDEALEFEADILPDLEDVTHVRDALTMLEAGLVTGISPGFRVPPNETVPGAERLDPEEGNPDVFIRSLAAVVLYELSLVTRPAYAESQAEIRAMQAAAHPVRKRRIFLP